MMSQAIPSRFQQAIDVVEALPPEDQETLIELIRRRLIERRKEDIARNAAETLQAVREGRAQYGMDMPQVDVTLTVEEIQTLVFRLPPLEFAWLADRMRERAETFEMMRLAETGFAEWNEPGEDIYDHLADESQAR